MRVLLKVTFGIEKFNAAVASGKMDSTLGSILADLKPEATYFVALGGKRTGLFFVNIDEPSQMVGLAEPFFLAFDADVEFLPAMTPEDLAKAGPDFERVAKKYA